MAKSVLLVGLDPYKIDFSDSAYSTFPDLTASKIQKQLELDESTLNKLGYDAELCLTPVDTIAAAQIIIPRLKAKAYDCVMIGAGVRMITSNFLMFEALVNLVHEHAPQAKFAFNTRPDNTADAVKRWI
ncbi:hypothetical protein KDX27_39555 [Burkholderia cenocepacia]|uniref:hypothetical protein n=1 Tax=Burkholderia cenocepacia TaxID=95486 RepID=UPI00196B96A1|nr:hypothetical protein [Burkholderia cenocepacia]MBN3534167.1 hypothetical protein [Burkholderia cenocepacia]MBR8029964.1 hypothetical protein [Burkholderia cenocepacia]MBR8173789.1 hypothetical protein [Burkholderia cenocepacia]MBR8429065.1 hypothetical protein [Burkholderia cenocepacia]MBU9659632.1 hypothetical protein [Burkholderia cenocepacia]